MSKNQIFVLTFLILSLAPAILAQESLVAQALATDTLRSWTAGWNVATLPKSGTPSCLVTFSSESFPVFQTDQSRCGTFGAAAVAGFGRVAAFSQNGYTSPTGYPALYNNVRNWVARGRTFNSSQVLDLNSITEARLLQANLSQFVFAVWTGPNNFPSNQALDKLEAFVRNGGGLITGYPGWVYTAYNGFASHLDVSTNKLLLRFGIVNTGNYLSGTLPSISSVPSVQNLNAYYSVKAGLLLPAQLATFQFALEELPIEAIDSVDDIRSYLESIPSENLTFPIKGANVRGKIVAQYLAKKFDNIANPRALPGLEKLPGVVTSSERLTVTLTAIRESSDSWISTGYYLAAGEVLTVTAKSPIENWQIRIGCHSDNIAGKEDWARYPQVTKQQKLTGVQTRVTSPFGGLIYLVSSGSKSNITVELANVVEAAFFDLNLEQPTWNPNAAAPVAEIQGKYLTMSLPSSSIRNLTDPAAVARYWDRIIEEDHILRATQATRRERFVADIEISAGYMHSGYPIMTYLDVVTANVKKGEIIPFQVNLKTLTSGGSWGHFHEVGHNLQRGWWTFEGTGEVTNNIFSLLGGWTCCNLTVKENGWIRGKYNATALKLNQFINKTKQETYAWYQSDPGAFLVQYALIQNYFGWEAFRKTFAAYEATNGPRPSDNQEKIDVWVRELSKSVGRNLLPYYEIWRMPISNRGVEQINALGLPLWMPENGDFAISHINQAYLNQIRKSYSL